MSKRFASLALWLLCLGLVAALAAPASAQTIISGEAAVTVIDPAGAVVPNAPVTIKSDDTGASETTPTNSSGFVRFSFLRPGSYTITIDAPGFAAVSQKAAVSLGKVTAVPIQLQVKGTSTTVEVTAAAPLLQTENANITANYSRQDVELLPSPGQDLTNYALSAPGSVLSTGAGYGNFTAFGLPGTSNLYTINGGDMNDPYNNLNNSGSSNNMLGTNEVQELTIVSNGYTGQYGRAAGVNMNITTKSGTNSFHGDGSWWWTGRSMAAQDWFLKQSLTPQPFANSNQWGGSISGPIKKDKLFFFYDNEGLRYVLFAPSLVNIPTKQFEAATIANLNASGLGALVPFYTKGFNLYNSANGASRATPLTAGQDPALGCGDLAATDANGNVIPGSPDPAGGAFGTASAVPCAASYRGGNGNLNIERLMSVRVDWNQSDSSKWSFRWWEDRGTQPTHTDAISPLFNTLSVQPQDSGQFTWTKTFTPRTINQLIVGGFNYQAVFNAKDFNASVAGLPWGGEVQFLDGAPFYNMGGTLISYPQGRKVSQIQIVDDFSWSKGDHNLKFGMNGRGNRLTDLTPFRGTSGRLRVFSMTDFFGGIADRLQQTLEQTSAIALQDYSLGVYAQDEWRASSKLKLTLSLRVDRNSNEKCFNKECISRLNTDFESIGHSVSIPYSAQILTNLHEAFPNIQKVVWEPRVGFAYSPGSQKTVLRGGVGLFSDLYPAQIAERFITNPPFTSSLTINSTALGGPADYCMARGVSVAGLCADSYNAASVNYNSFITGFAAGQTVNQIAAAVKAAGSLFAPPVMAAPPQTMQNPRYLEWNFEVQRSFGSKTMLSLNYVGNHGSNLIVINPGLNTFCRVSATRCATGVFGQLPIGPTPSAANGFVGGARDGRFAGVSQLTNNGISNYNGLTTTFTRRLTKGFTGTLTYTWSHSLDEISNAGLQPYSTNQSGDSIETQIDPFNLRRLNYGPSDYDFRHVLSASYVWELPFHSSSGIFNQVIGGWSLSGLVHLRSGQPYTVINSSLGGSLSNATAFNTGTGVAGIPAVFLGGTIPSCNHPAFSIDNPYQCLNAKQFDSGTPSQTDFGNVARNHFRGPKFFDTDMSVYKAFKVSERVRFTLGIIAYNVFNHPNFGNPDNDIADGSTFGQLTSTVTPASSPYGNFQGAAVSGRVLQTLMKIQF